MNITLDHNLITRSAETLYLRISERFPKAEILNTCRGLIDISRAYDLDIKKINNPDWLARTGVLSFLAVAVMALIYTAGTLDLSTKKATFFEIIQFSEAALNEFFIIGATLVFLFTLEKRLKRNRIIGAVNKLRCIAHIIDMHQLTKDPSAMVESIPTEHSPERKLTPYELSRYLNYCTEMLALTSKLGFAYVQNFNDHEALNAVNDLESLTTGLSRKIWQKIMLIKL